MTERPNWHAIIYEIADDFGWIVLLAGIVIAVLALTE